MVYADPLYRSAPLHVSQRVLALDTILISMCDLSSEKLVYQPMATNEDKRLEMLPARKENGKLDSFVGI
jgi:hypothetical protein